MPILIDYDPHARLTSRPAGVPSVHVRAVITWLAVFPMVAIGLTVLTPYTAGSAPVLRILALTLVVVPLAVYLVVPWLLNLYAGFVAARR